MKIFDCDFCQDTHKISHAIYTSDPANIFEPCPLCQADEYNALVNRRVEADREMRLIGRALMILGVFLMFLLII
jgi:hypothetical protein